MGRIEKDTNTRPPSVKHLNPKGYRAPIHSNPIQLIYKYPKAKALKPKP